MTADGRAPAPTDAPAPAPPPVERHLEVVKTARFFQTGTVTADTSQVWFACHGYRQLAGRFVRRFVGLGDLGVVVAAPEALSRFYIDPAPGRHGAETRVGASWMTRADREREIADYVSYLDRLAEMVLAERPKGAAAPKTVALGFSQGVHTAARWAVLGRTPVDELVLWGAYLPRDLPADDRLRRPGLTLVFGDDDPTADTALAQEQAERLEAAGVRPRRVSCPGGHRVDPEVVRALARRFGRSGEGSGKRGQNSPTKSISGSSS